MKGGRPQEVTGDLIVHCFNAQSISTFCASFAGIEVILKDVNLFTTGLFGCEASAEESFHTALVRKHLTVLGKHSMLRATLWQ